MIGGCGLAGMIWRLAKLRTLTNPRLAARSGCTCRPCAEFYNLTDLAWKAFGTVRRERARGMNTEGVWYL